MDKEKFRRYMRRQSKSSKSSQKSLSSLLKSRASRVVAPYTLYGIQADVTENKIFTSYADQKPSILLDDWSEYLNNTDNIYDLLRKSSQMLKQLTSASDVNLYLVDASENEIYYAGSMTGERIRWKIGEKKIVAAYVAHSLNYVMVDKVYTDRRFPDGVAYEPLAGPVICCPILVSEVGCYAVIELYRKAMEPAFAKEDLEFTIMVTVWIGVAIKENLDRLELEKQRVLSDYLLNIMRCFYADPTLMRQTITDTVNFARVTLNACRCSFYIFSDSKLADGTIKAELYESDEHLPTSIMDTRQSSLILLNKRPLLNPIDLGQKVFLDKKGIVEYVAKTGKTLNVKDATSDCRFTMPDKGGNLTRSILCMPIECYGEVMGVAQVKNKLDGKCFTASDEMLFRTFSVYCSLATYYHRHHKQMKMAHYYTVSFEKLLRLIQPCEHIYRQISEHPFEKLPDDFFSISFDVPQHYVEKMPRYILYMFIKLIGGWSIHVQNTAKFILQVQMTYVDLPFHNIIHAFRFTHIMFLLLLRNTEKFTNFEKKGLLVGGFCHDMNHSGLSNRFLELVKHDTAMLYEDSFHENNAHFMTLQLLRTSKIFCRMTPCAFELLATEIKDTIKATHWFNYYKMWPILQRGYIRGFSWQNPSHRNHIKRVMSLKCEFSAIWKPYPLLKQAFLNYYREVLREGELHVIMGRTPTFGLEKRKLEDCAESQAKLMRLMLLPGLRVLRTVLSNLDDFYDYAITLTENWDIIANLPNYKLWSVEEEFEPV